MAEAALVIQENPGGLIPLDNEGRVGMDVRLTLACTFPSALAGHNTLFYEAVRQEDVLIYVYLLLILHRQTVQKALGRDCLCAREIEARYEQSGRAAYESQFVLRVG